MRIGPFELLLILAVVLIVFGAGRLPEIGSAIPRAWKDFRRGTTGELDDDPLTPDPAPRPIQPEVSANVAGRRPARQTAHPLRGIGLILVGIGLVIFYLDSEVFRIGLPLQAASGVVALLGVILFFR